MRVIPSLTITNSKLTSTSDSSSSPSSSSSSSPTPSSSSSSFSFTSSSSSLRYSSSSSYDLSPSSSALYSDPASATTDGSVFLLVTDHRLASDDANNSPSSAIANVPTSDSVPAPADPYFEDTSTPVEWSPRATVANHETAGPPVDSHPAPSEFESDQILRSFWPP